MKEYSQDWFTHNQPKWEKFLTPLRGQDHLNFLEIGSYEGRSAVWLLENVLTGADCHLTCIDTFNGGAEHDKKEMIKVRERFFSNTQEYGDKIKLIEETSLSALTSLLWVNLMGPIFDFIYVDGSHDASDVLFDAVASHHLLKKGGIIIFDDYQWRMKGPAWTTPKPAIESFYFCFQDEYTVLEEGYQIMLRKTY